LLSMPLYFSNSEVVDFQMQLSAIAFLPSPPKMYFLLVMEQVLAVMNQTDKVVVVISSLFLFPPKPL
jgi:hypothetical protein